MKNELLKFLNDAGMVDVTHNEINDMQKTIKNKEILIEFGLAEPNHIDKISSIEELRATIEKFEGCSIKKIATNTVFADGISTSEVMVIGEAPGNNEDIEGVPFCGASGVLLDNMLSTIGLSRKTNLYISNVLFWRPPGNRRPTDEELLACKPFVEKHISLIAPKLLIAVGSTAFANLLGSTETISKASGKVFPYNNQYLATSIPVIPIFHPSYLLRQPLKKREAWNVLLKIEDFMRELCITL